MNSTIAAKLLIVVSQLPKLVKNQKMAKLNWRYLPLPELLDKIIPLLTKNKLYLYHDTKTTLISDNLIEHEVIATVEDVDSGSKLVTSAKTYIRLDDGSPQLTTWKLQSATTMLRRYTICNLLSLAPDDDDGTVETLIEAAQPQPHLQPQATNVRKVSGIAIYAEKLAAKCGKTPQDYGVSSFSELDEKQLKSIIAELRYGL